MPCATCAANTWLDSFILKWWPSTKQLDLFGVLLFNCSKFCHPPLAVLSDFQELLCPVFVREEELCYAMFSAGSRFALVSWLHCVGNRCHPVLWDKGPSQFSRQFLCCIVQIWPYFTYCSDWTAFWLLSVNLKMVTLMFDGSMLFDFAKTIGFMAWSITGSNKSSLQSSCLKGTYAFRYLYFDLDWQ